MLSLRTSRAMPLRIVCSNSLDIGRRSPLGARPWWLQVGLIGAAVACPVLVLCGLPQSGAVLLLPCTLGILRDAWRRLVDTERARDLAWTLAALSSVALDLWCLASLLLPYLAS